MALPEQLDPLYRHLRQALSLIDPESGELEARLIIKQRTGFDWSAIIVNPQQLLNVEVIKQIESDLEKRLSGMPLSRIYGEKEFWGRKFKINSHVLDPRPDTETLIDRVLDKFHVKQPIEILDLGVGSGCILATLLLERPLADGTGVDFSINAIETAKTNLSDFGLQNRSRLFCGNWAEALNYKFDLIVSNPPYISSQEMLDLPQEVGNHDPILALDGGEKGLDAYKKIFFTLPYILKAGGTAFFEIGSRQKDDIVRLAGESRIRIESVHEDIGGRPRVVEISHWG